MLNHFTTWDYPSPPARLGADLIRGTADWLGRKEDCSETEGVKNAAVETPKIVNETPAPQVQAVLEPAPTEATA